jgi:hypothetical protein
MWLLAWKGKHHLAPSLFRRILDPSNAIILLPELKWPEPKAYTLPKLWMHGVLHQRPTCLHVSIYKSRYNSLISYLIKHTVTDRTYWVPAGISGTGKCCIQSCNKLVPGFRSLQHNVTPVWVFHLPCMWCKLHFPCMWCKLQFPCNASCVPPTLFYVVITGSSF